VGWAQAGGDYQLVSYGLGRKTNIAVWVGDHREAVDFAESGRQVPWEVPPGLASVNAQYEARAHALARDESGTLRLLDDSRELIESRERLGEDRIYWARRRTPSHLRASAAHSYVNLGRLPEAIDMLEALLPDRQPEPHHVGTLSLLALAHAKAGDPFAATAVGEKALDLAVSASALIILAETSQELRRWAGETRVLAFRQRLQRQRTPVGHQAVGLAPRQCEPDQSDG